MTRFPPRRLIAAGLLLGATCAIAQESRLDLNCDKVDPREPEVEATLVRQFADGIVVRKSGHLLLVTAAGKTLRFEDKPPYDRTDAGVVHHFCDRRGGFMLVTTEEQNMTTGTLINEATGEATPAGQRVVFSDDRRAYLAIRQTFEYEEQAWTIRSVQGRLSWEGFSFIPDERDREHVVARLTDPTWRPSGEFTATARCNFDDALPWTATLTKISGKWDWTPKHRCTPISSRPDQDK